jgi:hypothetical protein
MSQGRSEDLDRGFSSQMRMRRREDGTHSTLPDQIVEPVSVEHVAYLCRLLIDHGR